MACPFSLRMSPLPGNSLDGFDDDRPRLLAAFARNLRLVLLKDRVIPEVEFLFGLFKGDEVVFGQDLQELALILLGKDQLRPFIDIRR